MDGSIGEAAGDVYRFIEISGPVSVAQLRKATGHKESTVNLALGWLAREEKVVREPRGRTVRWDIAKC